jgi:CheY-like chemotaxis protein/anti-sigma regulatory factor (Ser/Thr protein kinase)
MIHERLYRSANLTSINLGEYLRTLAEELFLTFTADRTRIQLQCAVEEIVTDLQNILPCGLIVNELISNALKYAFPTGEGVVTLSLRRDGRLLVLSVRDNGVGLPEKFDIHDTRSLGMKLVTSLTSQMNGTIKVNRSQGTEFRISFRDYCTEPLVEQILAESRPDIPPEIVHPTSQMLNILIAEDNLVNRLYMQMTLEGAGHTVVTAANGEEALKALATHRVDLVLMDVEMPTMNGLEAVAAIRRGEVAGVDPKLPVYAISGADEEDDVRRQSEAGMDGFLKKPFEAFELLDLVQQSQRVTGDVS